MRLSFTSWMARDHTRLPHFGHVWVVMEVRRGRGHHPDQTAVL